MWAMRIVLSKLTNEEFIPLTTDWFSLVAKYNATTP